MSSFKVVARSQDLLGQGPHALAAGDTDLVVLRTPGGQLRAFEGRCPHRGALLGEGELHDGVLVCRNHRWRFDVESGRRDGGPECLAACPIREEGGNVLVDVTALTEARDAAILGENARRVEELPGPPQLPLIGSSHVLDPDRLHLQLEAWAHEYGTPYAFSIGPQKTVVFSDMNEMAPMFRERPERFQRGSNLAPVFRELGVEGVFSAEGAAWRPQRRLSMEALSHRHLRGFYPTLATVAGRLRARWLRAAERGESLDFAEELKRFTVDVTTQLVFGYDIDTIGKDDDVIQEKLGLLFPAFNRRLFAVIPTWRILRMPSDRAVDRAVAELREWIGGLVRASRERLEADPARAASPANFLEAMLVARDERGEPFSDDAIFGNAMTMLLAGEDTTAYTLAWAVHHLIDAPAEVKALREELRSVLGTQPVPPDIEVANRLQYAGAIANEAMRIRPVAPMLFFEPTHDAVVAGVALKKGTLAVALSRAPAMSEKNFAAPNEFKPARWIDGPGEGGAHEAGAHQPFGSGPRICPGRTLALLEMKLLLGTLFQTFDVSRVGDKRDVTEVFSFTMMPRGLNVKLRRRGLAV